MHNMTRPDISGEPPAISMDLLIIRLIETGHGNETVPVVEQAVVHLATQCAAD